MKRKEAADRAGAGGGKGIWASSSSSWLAVKALLTSIAMMAMAAATTKRRNMKEGKTGNVMTAGRSLQSGLAGRDSPIQARIHARGA
jgi:hypothetical protein